MSGDRLFNRRNAWVIALAFTVISLFSAFQAMNLGFTYDIESFFNPKDPELAYYLEYRNRFENDNALILIAVEADGSVFDTAFLQRLDLAVKDMEALPEVEYVTSPTRMHRFMLSPFGIPFKLDLLHSRDAEALKADSARIYREKTLLNSIFPEDAQSISLLLKARSHISEDVHKSLLAGIDKSLRESGFKNYHLGGRIIVENFYVQLIIRDLILISILTLLVMTIILWMIYRSPIGILLPLAIMVISVLITLAVIKVSGSSINLMLSMLPAIMFVVCVGDSIHIINKFIYELRKGLDKASALRIALKEVGLATFLTSFTTAIGFATLAFMGIPPLKEFGLFVALGVMLAYFVTILLLPAMLFIIPGSSRFGTHEDRFRWSEKMDRLYTTVIRRRRYVIIYSVLFIGLMTFGIQRLKVNNHFLDDLSESSVLKKDMHYFEDHYSGIRSLEIGLAVKDSSQTLFDPPVLEELERVGNFLITKYGAGALWSPLNISRIANQALHGGDETFIKVPEDTRMLKKVLLTGNEDLTQGMAQSFWSEDLRKGRFSGRMHDVGSSKVSDLNEELAEFITNNTRLVDYRITGSMHLVDNNNKHLSLNLLLGLGISFLIISLIIYVMFRSWRMALIALVPNVIPLIVVAGMMGVLGIDMKVPTAMVFTIAFGVAVDNTLHILSRLRIELSKGKNYPEAVYYSFINTGKSVVLSAVILILGFLVFLLSESRASFTVGVMISITLMVALWADLVILPLLLRPWRR